MSRKSRFWYCECSFGWAWITSAEKTKTRLTWSEECWLYNTRGEPDNKRLGAKPIRIDMLTIRLTRLQAGVERGLNRQRENVEYRRETTEFVVDQRLAKFIGKHHRFEWWGFAAGDQGERRFNRRREKTAHRSPWCWRAAYRLPSSCLRRTARVRWTGHNSPPSERYARLGIFHAKQEAQYPYHND